MRLSGKVMKKQNTNKVDIAPYIIILLSCEVINRRAGPLYFTHDFCWRDHSGSSASFRVWLSGGTCGLYLGYSFVSGLAGSRSKTNQDLLSVVIIFLD